MHSSANRVLAELVGSEITKSSSLSKTRSTAFNCDGHRSISARSRAKRVAMKFSRSSGQSTSSGVRGSSTGICARMLVAAPSTDP